MTDTQSLLTAALADRYRIERELGRGGMATVFLAQDLKHERKVAIKLLRPELAAIIGAERDRPERGVYPALPRSRRQGAGLFEWRRDASLVAQRNRAVLLGAGAAGVGGAGGLR